MGPSGANQQRDTVLRTYPDSNDLSVCLVSLQFSRDNT